MLADRVVKVKCWSFCRKAAAVVLYFHPRLLSSSRSGESALHAVGRKHEPRLVQMLCMLACNARLLGSGDLHFITHTNSGDMV